MAAPRLSDMTPVQRMKVCIGEINTIALEVENSSALAELLSKTAQLMVALEMLEQVLSTPHPVQTQQAHPVSEPTAPGEHDVRDVRASQR